MNKKMTAALLLAGMMICVSACGNKQAQYYPTQERFRQISTETTKFAKNPVYEDTSVDSKSSWSYGKAKIANVIDKGFAAAK